VSGLRVGSTSAFCAVLSAWVSACGRLGYEALLVPADAGPDTDAGADPTAEQALATGTSNAEHPALAFTGDGYSVVWDDDRDGERELYLQRVVGGLPSGAAVRLTQASGYSGFPSLAWSGSELAAAWEDARLGSDEIFFSRFDRTGGGVGPQARLSYAAGLAYDPFVTWNGERFAVAWEDGGGLASDIYFALTTTANTTLGTPVQRSNAAGRSLRSSVAWTGAEFGIAWEDDRDGDMQTFFARCDANSAPLGVDDVAAPTTGRSFGPSLAWSGSVYGVAYEDNRNGLYQVFLALLDASGLPTGTDVALTDPSVDAGEASLVWAKDHWAVAYLERNQVWLVEVPANPVPPFSPRLIGSMGGHAENPKLAWTGFGYGVVWQDRRSGNWDVYFREVAP
jgi:hypothetical protein